MKLKPCPFCGDKIPILGDRPFEGQSQFCVYCPVCGSEGPVTPVGGNVDKKLAIKNARFEWNKRVNNAHL